MTKKKTDDKAGEEAAAERANDEMPEEAFMIAPSEDDAPPVQTPNPISDRSQMEKPGRK